MLTVGALALTVVAAFVAAVRDPIVREAKIGLADWPARQPPLRLLLVSDIHVAGPDMPPSRVARLVRQINRLSPDVVLLAGDFISDKRIATRQYSLDEAILPLAELRAPLGSFAVLGNHDHWRDAAQTSDALSRAGIDVLDNKAARAGPIVIGGLNDDFTGHADSAATIAAMRRLKGARILLSHSPDPFPAIPAEVGLMVAGHTHCGQMAFPLIGPIATMSRYGKRYACGIIREPGRTLIVSAGVGTSLVPLRIGVPPDMWLIQVGPVTAQQ
jgi:uncharacterized protein